MVDRARTRTRTGTDTTGAGRKSNKRKSNNIYSNNYESDDDQNQNDEDDEEDELYNEDDANEVTRKIKGKSKAQSTVQPAIAHPVLHIVILHLTRYVDDIILKYTDQCTALDTGVLTALQSADFSSGCSELASSSISNSQVSPSSSGHTSHEGGCNKELNEPSMPYKDGSAYHKMFTFSFQVCRLLCSLFTGQQQMTACTLTSTSLPQQSTSSVQHKSNTKAAVKVQQCLYHQMSDKVKSKTLVLLTKLLAKAVSECKQLIAVVEANMHCSDSQNESVDKYSYLGDDAETRYVNQQSSSATNQCEPSNEKATSSSSSSSSYSVLVAILYSLNERTLICLISILTAARAPTAARAATAANGNSTCVGKQEGSKGSMYLTKLTQLLLRHLREFHLQLGHLVETVSARRQSVSVCACE